jgi:hypothetical protein
LFYYFPKRKKLINFFLLILCQRSITSAKASIRGPSHHYFYHWWQRTAQAKALPQGDYEWEAMMGWVCVWFFSITLYQLYFEERCFYLFIYLFSYLKIKCDLVGDSNLM